MESLCNDYKENKYHVELYNQYVFDFLKFVFMY